MKILHAGNVANLGYLNSRELRRHGIDVDLLMEKNPPKGSDPARFDSTLNNIYPEWILFYDKRKSSWKTNIIEVMRNKKYDLIHAYVELPIFAYLSRRPYIAHAQGSDFRELAFSTSLRGFLLRRAYRSAKLVLISQADHIALLPKLKLKNYIFLPIMWDTSFYSPQEVPRSEFSDKFIIFHPANLEWRLKHNDILIKGFAQFVKDNPDSVLLIVDRGPDSQKTHQLVNSLDIEDKTKFVKGPLNSSELLLYYNMADVVADQFAVGSIGSVGLETFCCAKPLITFIHEKLHKDVYDEMPPLLNTSNPSQVCEQMEYLKDRRIRIELGKLGRKWVTKYHSPEIFVKKIHIIYESVLHDEKTEEIREKISKIIINKDLK